MFVLELKIILVILQLLPTPIMLGVGVEQLDKCVLAMFREALPITVTIGYDDLTGDNEDSVIFWCPLGNPPPRGLGRAWWEIGSEGGLEAHLHCSPLNESNRNSNLSRQSGQVTIRNGRDGQS
ncbi:Hypothetical predicted protein [Olea europaea subsp. europaea]|uniref:Secreted protein n=1 Tax=Olea europaea subsp. europaea TaxID=158383 RepID=A0A8S0QAW2_OLEEU|nr:Hypothetical predicted protein [Olea europaea subsp. europaea]